MGPYVCVPGRVSASSNVIFKGDPVGQPQVPRDTLKHFLPSGRKGQVSLFFAAEFAVSPTFTDLVAASPCCV